MACSRGAVRLFCTAALMLVVFLSLFPLVSAGRNFYEVLGLKNDADDKQIKRAYRKMSRKLHPDMNRKDPNANDKFAELGNAYEVLIDPEKRQKYDLGGEEALKPDQGGRGGGFGDFFGFGGGGQRGGEKRKPTITMPVEATLQEVYMGGTRAVRMRKQILCSACRGTGAAGGKVTKCTRCDGNGFVIERREVGNGFVQQVQNECRRCKGKGRYSKNKCTACEDDQGRPGSGVQTGEEDLEVYIEQGIPDGGEIVFEGKGDQGKEEAAAHVKFLVETLPHPLFRRDGKDLHIQITVTMLEALFGFTRTIEHLDGHIVTIDREEQVTKPGLKQTIKGEGMPVHNFPSDRGVLVAEYVVRLPTELTPAQEKAIKLAF